MPPAGVTGTAFCAGRWRSDAVAAVVAVLFVVNPAVWGPGMGLRISDVLLVPFVLLTAKVIGLYDRDQNLMRKTTIDEAPSIFYLAVIYALAVWLCEVFLFKNYLFRPQVLALVMLTFLLVTLGRLTVRRLAVLVAPCERCIVIGNAVEAARLAAKLGASSSVNSCVIGRISLLQHPDPTRELAPGEVAVLGDYAQLGQIVSEHEVERVIIAPRNDGRNRSSTRSASSRRSASRSPSCLGCWRSSARPRPWTRSTAYGSSAFASSGCSVPR